METNENIGYNKGYKDTLFRFLFARDKKSALSLYNAINRSNYTNEEDLEFTTLEDTIYMKMKNDVSFIVGETLNLYEHQSTYNPNMPLRGLFYFADLYRQLIEESERLYGKKLIKIPTPNYVVFYNGTGSDMREEVVKLRLSDSFEHPDLTGGFEWTATMLNINQGCNKDLLDKCRILKEYSAFVEKIKTYRKSMKLPEAIDRAVEESIQEGILSEVLAKHRREVKNMTLTEFDEKKYAEIVREEGREEGRSEGEYIKLISMIRKKLAKKVTAEVCAEMLEEPYELVNEIYRIMDQHSEYSDERIAEQLIYEGQ